MDPSSRYRRATIAVISAVAALTAACSSSSSNNAGSTPPSNPSSSGFSISNVYPVTLQAANGEVTVAHRPVAIVSLSPTATEDLFAIGAGSQVKAVDKNSDYPTNAPHTKLDAYQLNIESLAAYQPDLVVASNLTNGQLKQLKTLGIPTLVEPAATSLSQAYDQLTTLGLVTGHPDNAAAEVTKIRQQVSSIVKGAHSPATYYYELDQTYYSETSSTFIGQVLKLLGLTSIADSAKGAAASGGYPQLSAEFILKADPDYVFLADSLCCKQSAATVAKRPGWSTLGAVSDNRIVVLNDDIASRWGPRIVDLLQTVADALHQHPVK
jgi:iron complex transport system substrate-binding protein